MHSPILLLLSLLPLSQLAHTTPTHHPQPLKHQHLARSTQFQTLEATNLAFTISDFLISNITSFSSLNPSNATTTSSLSFRFTDPNSNTSTTCSATWLKAPATNTTTTIDATPFGPSYVRCASLPNSSEFFAWHFNTYSNPGSFSLELAHEFADPVHYPPPYSTVEYFARSTDANLTATDAAGEFHLPSVASPLHAAVNSVSN